MLRKKITVIIVALIFALYSFGACSLIIDNPPTPTETESPTETVKPTETATPTILMWF